MRYAEIAPHQPALFELPIAQVHYLDDPEFGLGDEGWGREELFTAIQQNGLENPILVGKSKYQVEHENDHHVYCFNGNHRLSACRKLGQTTVLCMKSDAEDAIALTTQQIAALGGRTVITDD